MTHGPRLTRRRTLQLSGVAGLAALYRSVGAGPVLADEPRGGGPQAVLVLVQLAGGNDGLNTVVPSRDPRYRELRPGLALSEDEVLPLSEQVALHPALEPLLALWRARELAVVQGVGYERPNRSHFRSTDIWHTGSTSAEVRSDGWLGAVLSEVRTAEVHADNAAVADAGIADAVSLGGSAEGPFAGPRVRSLVIGGPGRFLRRLRGMSTAAAVDHGNPALRRLLDVERDLVAARTALGPLLVSPAARGSGAGKLSRELSLAARIIAADVGVRALHLKHSGFDTHAGQRASHGRLLGQLASALVGFRRELQDLGRWRDVVVVTYSEFGRRARENASGGTDHGTAGPQLVLGGRVRGGFYGQPPSLTDLDGDDLRFAVPFQQVFASVARDFLGLPDQAVTSVLGRQRSLGLFA